MGGDNGTGVPRSASNIAMALPRIEKIHIYESTLREGRQSGVSNFTLKDQIRILRMLSHFGVDWIEVGNPNDKTGLVYNEIKTLVAVGVSQHIIAHVRNSREDIKVASTIGVNGVQILCNVDELRLQRRNTTIDHDREKMAENVQFAQSLGLDVGVSVEHSFQDDYIDDAIKLFAIADELRVSRVGIADTKGILYPDDVYEKVSRIVGSISHALIKVHFHNDRFQAIGNAMAALKAGAQIVDTTVLGIGERNGIVALSMLICALLDVVPGLEERYAISKLKKIDHLIARILGISVPINFMTSDDAGCHKAGIHIDEAVNGLGAAHYEGVNPNRIGNKRQLLTGTPISGKVTAERAAAYLNAST